MPLGFPKISDQTPEFFYETHSLSYEIAKRLRDLRSAEETKPAPQVYLSLVERWNDPLHFRRSEVEGPLRQAGFEICPTRMFLPPDLEEAREYLRQVMSPCLVFAQLLDDRPNDPPSDPTRSFYGLQLEVARELGLPILQLRPQQIDWPALSKAKRHLLEDATVRTGSLQAFSDAIIQAAREEQRRRQYPVPPPPPPPVAATTAPTATSRPPGEPDGSPAADAGEAKADDVEAAAEAGHAAAEAEEVTADPDEVVADHGGVTAEVDETTADAEGTSEPRRVPAGRMIFVYNTEQDRDLARQVERTLESERLGYNGPIEERTDEEWDIDKEEELELRFGFEHCHASVMIYNRTQPFWVKFRLAYLSKLSLETSKWIGLLNGPEGCTPLRLSGPTLKDIDCRSGYDEGRLLQFFAELEKDPPI